MDILFEVIRILCHVLTVAIFIRALLSWVSPVPTSLLTVILLRITEPILSPLRRIIPRFGTWDFSPVVAIIILQLIARFLP